MPRKKIDLVIVPCKNCGKDMLVHPDPTKRKMGCSHECSEKLRAKRQSETKLARSEIANFIPQKKICVTCGNEFEATTPRQMKGKKTCSRSCQAKLAQLNVDWNLHKHWMKDPEKKAAGLAKMKATMIEKYGEDAASKILKERWSKVSDEKKAEIRAKAVKNTDYKAMAEKQKIALMEKYGVDNSMKNPEIAKRSKEAKNAKRPQIYRDIRTLKWWEENYINTKISLAALCRVAGVNEGTLKRAAAEVGVTIRKTTVVSQMEVAFRNRLSEYGIKFETNVKRLLQGNYEIDIWIPDHKLGIEFNGVYWHSDAVRRGKNNPPQVLHYNKYRWAKEKGITLLQFWDFEAVQKEQECIDAILECLGKKELGYFDYKEEVITDNRLALERYLIDYEIIQELPPKEWAVKNFASLVPIEEDNTSIRIWDAGYTVWKRKSPA